MSTEPLSTTTFTLTAADALAWERRPLPINPMSAFLFFAWLSLGAIAVALLPANWTGGWVNWNFWVIMLIFVAIQYVLAMLYLSLAGLRRARCRIRRPIEMLIEDWGDHLAVTGRGTPKFFAYAAIGEVILTPSHLFLTAADEVIILPRHAFPEEGTIESLAARISARNRAPNAAEAVHTGPIDPAPETA